MVLLAITLALTVEASTPPTTRLETKVFPPISMSRDPGGCANVLLTARITGPEDEKWYCPKVEWRHPDDTVSTEESDCPPYEEREEFPRVWRHRVCAPVHPYSLPWVVKVVFSKNGKTIASEDIQFLVR